MPTPADIPEPRRPPSVPPSPVPLGFLTLSSVRPATLRVDGKDTGLATPQTRMSLPAGLHVITLVDKNGAALESFTVTITAGAESVERRGPRPSLGPSK